MFKNDTEDKREEKQSLIAEHSCCYLVILWFINSSSLKASDMLIWKIKEEGVGERGAKGKKKKKRSLITRLETSRRPGLCSPSSLWC